MSKHAESIKGRIRTVDQILRADPRTVLQKRKCKRCEKQPRYLDFRLCLECLHKKVSPLPEMTQITVSDKCKRCGVNSNDLRDWRWRDDGTVKRLWCFSCVQTKFRIAQKKNSAEWEAEKAKFDAAQAAAIHAGKKLSVMQRHEARKRFGEAATKKPKGVVREGNVPMMRRLMAEGKSKQEIREIFFAYYAAKGQKDTTYILKRIKTYRKIVRKERKGEET